MAASSNIFLIEAQPASRATQYIDERGLDFYEINLNDLPSDDEAPKALRILEVLAYVFDHYGARECVKGCFG